MITLYGMGSPNVVKVFLALEETELPYETMPIDVFGGDQFSAAFKRLNPNAKVPVIVDDDGPGQRPITLFESGAILIYLAEKTGRFLATAGSSRYAALQWMMVQMTGIGPMAGQYVHFLRFAPKNRDFSYSLDRYRTQTRRFFATVDGRLAEAPYLAGDEYSIADIATFPWTRLLGPILGKEAEPDYPHLMAWNAKIASRPAAIRALAAMERVRAGLTTLDKAAPEMLDKVFGRGAFTL